MVEKSAVRQHPVAKPHVPVSAKLWREISRPFRPRQSRPVSTQNKQPTAVDATGLAAFDPQRCTVEPEGLRLLVDLVRASADGPNPGPIVEIGTLLGITATQMALAKHPSQKIITVDKYCWNPWKLPENQHFALARQVLYYLIETGQVVQVREDKKEFYASYAGPPPALVFLDAIHTYEETKRDIEWALAVGAKLIAGHDYCAEFPGVIQAVDEFGGPARLGGTVWCLKTGTTPADSGLRLPAGNRTPSRDQGKELEKGVVSIIVPAYNAREFIGLALEDIAKQTYDRWELIVVEDGSRENSEQIVQEFRRAHPEHRIEYHHKTQNTGVSSTRNLAVSLARGEFIAFLDADDRWEPHHLQRKVQYLRNTSADLVYSRVEMFDSDTDRRLCVWGARPEDLETFPESMFRGPYIQPSGVVIRHSLALDVGPFDENLAFGEDYDYWFRAIKLGKQFVFDEKVTSRYRKNHDSAATTDRLILCYEGTALVTRRHLNSAPGNRAARRRIVAKHFLRAGCGHMAFPASARNGCRPEKAPGLLLDAWRLRKHRLDYLWYYLLAHFAIATGSQRFFTRIFRRRVKR